MQAGALLDCSAFVIICLHVVPEGPKQDEGPFESGIVNTHQVSAFTDCQLESHKQT